MKFAVNYAFIVAVAALESLSFPIMCNAKTVTDHHGGVREASQLTAWNSDLTKNNQEQDHRKLTQVTTFTSIGTTNGALRSLQLSGPESIALGGSAEYTLAFTPPNGLPPSNLIFSAETSPLWTGFTAGTVQSPITFTVIVDSDGVASVTNVKEGGQSLSADFAPLFYNTAKNEFLLGAQILTPSASGFVSGLVRVSQSSGVGGDPHFKTWTGHHFDYQGMCDLVLLNAPSFGNGLGLDFHIRTTIHQDKEKKEHDEHEEQLDEGRASVSSSKFSYIERAALRIGSETLEVANDGTYYLNGEQQALPAIVQDHHKVKGSDESIEVPFMTISGFSVVYKVIKQNRRLLEIDLIPHVGKITIREYRGFLTVSFENGTADNFGDSRGLMGSFDSGKMLGRDGVTVMRDNPVAFGQEWQVRTVDVDPQLFNEIRAPQYPESCIMPQVSVNSMTSRGRRLLRGGVDSTEIESAATLALRDAAERACAKYDGSVREECIMDVMATGDMGMAEEVGAF